MRTPSGRPAGATPAGPGSRRRPPAVGGPQRPGGAAGDPGAVPGDPGPAGTPAPAAGAAAQDRRSDPPALRVLAAVLVALAAAGLAVLECFLVPLRIGTVPLPLCVPLAMAGNILLARLAARQTGSLVAAAVPPVTWLVVVVLLSLPRPEGDVVVEGSLTGLVFLFAGAVAGAYGVAGEITRRARPAAPIRR